MTIAALRQRIASAGIRLKLVVGVALVHLLLMTIFVLDLVQRQREFLLDELTRRTLHHALVLATSSAPWVMSDDLVGMEEVVEASSRGGDIRHAMIVDLRGRVLAHTVRQRTGQHLADPISLAALAGEKKERVYLRSAGTIHAIAPIHAGQQLIGWSILAADTSSTTAHLAYVTRTGVLYTLAAIAIGTVFAMLLARSMLRQLRLLLAGVDSLQNDVLDKPVQVIAGDEIGRVAGAFNRALASLTDGRERLTAEIGERLKAESDLRALSRRQVATIEEERRRIARDLHDELGQVLAGMQFGLKSLHQSLEGREEGLRDKCGELSSQIEQIGASMHRIANDLRPATLDHLGLLAALQAFVTEQNRLVGERISIAFDAAGFRRRLPAEVEMIAYRIVQEGLANVVKHAHATRAEIMLTVNHPVLIIAIRDDGAGISEMLNGDADIASTPGLGLLGMRERAASIGGTVSVGPRRGGGTVLRAELPYDKAATDVQDSRPDSR